MTDLKDVARLAGVSRATAARTFASPEQVRPATREQVFAAARELGFRPNLLGRQLRLQTTQLIGVVVPNLLNPVFAEQFQAMERAARFCAATACCWRPPTTAASASGWWWKNCCASASMAWC
jgi:DNA-binding LacI/PurR family transcriptional regulator